MWKVSGLNTPRCTQASTAPMRQANSTSSPPSSGSSGRSSDKKTSPTMPFARANSSSPEVKMWLRLPSTRSVKSSCSKPLMLRRNSRTREGRIEELIMPTNPRTADRSNSSLTSQGAPSDANMARDHAASSAQSPPSDDASDAPRLPASMAASKIRPTSRCNRRTKATSAHITLRYQLSAVEMRRTSDALRKAKQLLQSSPADAS
mmetsp:Transcript_53273/g.152702  ORF Transcript_53273/g.152702 Transcript_53273/m.152702 type:complete len:205 (+) Transcript_53273:257-871(+)